MNTPRFLIWFVMAGLLAGGGADPLFAQEKAAEPSNAMLNAWRGRASSPALASQIDVQARAVGTSGTEEAPALYVMNAWRGRVSPPAPAGQVDAERRAIGTAGRKEAPETPTYLTNAWRGRVSPPSPTDR